MGGVEYFSLFLISTFLSYSQKFFRSGRVFLWIFLSVFLILFVGARSEVGGDWAVYEGWIHSAKGQPILDAIVLTDPAYALLNWIGANWFGGVYLVNFVCGALAVVPLVLFCVRQEEPWIALSISMSYLVIVVFMGYTRQGVAIGIGMLAIMEAAKPRLGRYILYVTLAALFHKTAVCLFVLAPALFAGMQGPRRSTKILFAVAIGAAASVSLLLLWKQLGHLYHGYVSAAGNGHTGGGLRPVGALDSSPEVDGLHSSGAVVRLFQSVLAACCFMIIALRSRLEPSKLWVWTIASLVVAGLFALSFWKSTLADRVGLYFIPLQLYAFSTLPGLFKPPLASLLKLLIAAGAAASLWVWLNYGNHAASWLPYKNVLFL